MKESKTDPPSAWGLEYISDDFFPSRSFLFLVGGDFVLVAAEAGAREGKPGFFSSVLVVAK